ncbi:hypothetical protein N7V09_15970 [Shewanella seohaensis]|uniref:hypothetical protein n=1 Tax=Shewanella seohaensis TaxID=755175 RepID=UPI00200E581F|nr:hypothetical protein [Shewanella seohaensis]MCL1122348.1 hypothetical protein [Shewanella seohaensis]UXM81278.1 hypothetical protein N7V09_15970 [Shewanella seohaensis]
MAPEGRGSTRFILRLRLSTEHHYAFNPSPCLKRVELPLNEQIFNTIGIMRLRDWVYDQSLARILGYSLSSPFLSERSP